ncbi:MAG: hypothetical protein ACE5Z5_14100 [Candidatus Bathyarchaeia archaeon]
MKEKRLFSFKVVEVKDTPNGKRYTVRIGRKSLALILTWHALESFEDYGFKPESVLDCLIEPEEVVVGHGGRFIAHKRVLPDEYLLRVVYERQGELVVIITLYYCVG